MFSFYRVIALIVVPAVVAVAMFFTATLPTAIIAVAFATIAAPVRLLVALAVLVFAVTAVHGVVFNYVITVIPAVSNHILLTLPAPVLAVFGTVNIRMQIRPGFVYHYFVAMV